MNIQSEYFQNENFKIFQTQYATWYKNFLYFYGIVLHNVESLLERFINFPMRLLIFCTLYNFFFVGRNDDLME